MLIPIPSTPYVYHYCSVESFLAIMTSGKLRLTNAYFLNDSMEIEWFMRLCRQVWVETRSKRFAYFSESALTEFERLGELLKETPFSHTYFSCFSQLADDLSQWRAYGDDGAGVAIQCDLSQLAPHRPSTNDFHKYFALVSYGEEEATKQIRKLFLPGWMKDIPVMPAGFDSDAMFRYLASHGPLYKNPAFSAEQEVRLVVTEESHGLQSKENSPWVPKPFPREMIDFRTSNGRLIPFVALDFPQKCVKEVYLGPVFGGGKDVEAVKLLLEKYDLDIEVKRSSASYRR